MQLQHLPQLVRKVPQLWSWRKFRFSPSGATDLKSYIYIYIYIKICCTEFHGSTCEVTKLFLQPIYIITSGIHVSKCKTHQCFSSEKYLKSLNTTDLGNNRRMILRWQG